MASKGIFHCSIDDFYRGNATDLQNIVLKKTLEKYLPDIIGESAWSLTQRVFAETHISATPADMERFYEKYVKTLRLKLGEDGRFFVEML